MPDEFGFEIVENSEGSALAAESALLHPAEWDFRRGEKRFIDPAPPGFESLRRAARARRVIGEHICRKPEGQSIGAIQRLPLVGKGADRGDRREGLLAHD